MMSDHGAHEISKPDQADMDSYSLVEYHRLEKLNKEIRADKPRFSRAIAVIKKQNKDRKEAFDKETAARSAAVKK